jgi:superfamily II DNA or RNA helicase
MEIQHPLRAYLLQHGKVLIGDTAVALWTVLAMAKEPAFQGTRTWRRLESALHRFMGVEVLGGKPQPDSASFWKALLKAEAAIASPDPSVPMRELWTRAAMDGVVPDTVHIGTSGLPLSSVFVTSSEDLGRLAKRRARPTVILDETTLRIWVKAGAKRLDDLVLDSWESAGPDTLLISAVPELAEVMRPGDCVTGRYRPVTNLRLSLEGVPEEVPCLFRNGVMLLDLDRLFRCSRAARLESIVRELAGSGWLKCSVVDALRVLGDAGIDQRRAYVAAGATLPEKLLRAVGERREPLLEVLGDLSNLEFIRNRTALEIAHLVLALQGPGTFKDLQKTLEDEGLRPPQRWNGPEAGSFLESIGFPANFALPLDERREPEEFISGPMELRPLHDFQEEVLTGLKELLSSTSIRRRVVVSLPTGGGKTRVTVEAAVRLILAPPSGARSVLWVAQTDELCEQAVQSFKQVWVNLGALGTDLRIIRLWGGNPNPASHPRKDPVVVVASIQTLNSRIRSESLNWLNEPGIVVVDECHHAITPSYTNLLRWLDMMPSKAAAEKRPEPPIVGLSATPFRTDEDESTRLAKRFDNAWLPSDQPSLYSRLRAQGVLAEPIYEALDSGVMLLAEEIDRFSAMPQPWEGLEFENLLEQLNQRLATIESRSEKIVDVIQRSSERAILLFANSVIHGEEMAARLNLAGIPAAAVSGTSSPAVRRYFLDCFKRGELRVLCNHSVLTTGFDAPNTDMVLIARQVFSPVRYMQIVGRGLRGIKNGGTAVCRIVTVMDNLGRFKDRHPFYYCQHNFAAWTGSEV